MAFEIPDGYVGLIFPRSSLSKYDLEVSNHVGVIDSGYRGEVVVKFKPQPHFDLNNGVEYSLTPYFPGDRVAQMIILPYPKIHFKEVEMFGDTERGVDGHGSIGN